MPFLTLFSLSYFCPAVSCWTFVCRPQTMKTSGHEPATFRTSNHSCQQVRPAPAPIIPYSSLSWPSHRVRNPSRQQAAPALRPVIPHISMWDQTWPDHVTPYQHTRVARGWGIHGVCRGQCRGFHPTRIQTGQQDTVVLISSHHVRSAHKGSPLEKSNGLRKWQPTKLCITWHFQKVRQRPATRRHLFLCSNLHILHGTKRFLCD